MNHIKSNFIAADGEKIPYHSWEIRQGGYSRIAIVIGDPYLPVEENKRLIDFLLENYFKVYAPLIPETNPDSNNCGGLDEYQSHVGGFRSFVEGKEGNLKMIPMVFSVSVLPFLSYYFKVLPSFERIVLFSPVLDYTGNPVASSGFLKKRINLSFNESMLSEVKDERESIEKLLLKNPSISKKLVKDLRKEFKVFPPSYPLDSVNTRIGIFYGESDELVSLEKIDALKNSLKNAKVETHSYPRMRHFLFNDKYWKNMLNDLKIFLS